MYRNAFYYQRDGLPMAVRYDLARERETARRRIEGASHQGENYIYAPSGGDGSSSSASSYQYMDFQADEHGLWLIYRVDASNRTMVAYLDPRSLKQGRVWNVSFDHNRLGTAIFLGGGILLARVTFSVFTVGCSYVDK